jgi:hypothetical protein
MGLERYREDARHLVAEEHEPDAGGTGGVDASNDTMPAHAQAARLAEKPRQLGTAEFPVAQADADTHPH